MKKLYTHSHGPDPDARHAAMGRLILEAQAMGSQNAVLALPFKRNIENYNTFFSRDQIRAFAGAGRATINGVDVYLWAKHGDSPLPVSGPVLVLDGPPSLAASVQEMAEVVLYVPWMETERDEYLANNPDAIRIFP